MDDLNLNELNLNDQPQELEPIPFDDEQEHPEVSHAPLDIGGNGSAPAQPAPAPVPQPTVSSAPPAGITMPQIQQKAEKAVDSTGERITGCKIFFTKLHAGAVDFMSEQISDWLTANPNVTIKQTNAVVGEVAAKKTEPNLIITVWY